MIHLQKCFFNTADYMDKISGDSSVFFQMDWNQQQSSGATAQRETLCSWKVADTNSDVKYEAEVWIYSLGKSYFLSNLCFLQANW